MWLLLLADACSLIFWRECCNLLLLYHRLWVKMKLKMNRRNELPKIEIQSARKLEFLFPSLMRWRKEFEITFDDLQLKQSARQWQLWHPRVSSNYPKSEISAKDSRLISRHRDNEIVTETFIRITMSVNLSSCA